METLNGLIEDLRSGDDTKAHAAVRKIAAYGAQAVPQLESLLESPDHDIRWWATWAVSEVRVPEAGGLLLKMLRDPDDSVKECAALALRQQPLKEAVPELIKSLSSSDKTLAHLSAAALVAAGKDAVLPLIGVLKNGTQSARLHAVRALAEIGDHRAIPIMMKVMDEDSALLQHWAKEGLERLGLNMVYIKPV